jgi:integral membrane protein (TIGR01906 family)
MKRFLTGFMLAITVLLFTTAAGLAFIHISGFPYSADIEILNICESSGFSSNEILLNYNAMLEYLSPFSKAEFSLPTMRYSESGSYHFAQCKALFNTVYLLGFVSAILLLILSAAKAVSRKTLRVSAIITIIVPLLLNCAFSINPDRAFVIFHLIFFKGKSWIFDPKLDELIKILPVDYFVHCAYVLALFWLIGAVVLFAMSSYQKKQQGKII